MRLRCLDMEHGVNDIDSTVLVHSLEKQFRQEDKWAHKIFIR